MEKYYCYCPESGFDTFNTAEEAKESAQQSIDYFRENSSEGWNEEVSQVSWGEITEQADICEEKPLTKELKAELSIACNADTYRDYALTSVDMKKPELGVDCVIWCAGEPKVDRLTDEDHHEAYWAESLYAFGDEDKFIVLPA